MKQSPADKFFQYLYIIPGYFLLITFPFVTVLTAIIAILLLILQPWQ